MKRFFKELFKPALTCDRVGHKLKEKQITIRKRGGLMAVCTDYTATIFHCSRCGHKTEPVNPTEKTSFQSVSMPKSCWDEMDENGYMVVN